ncbi:integumentary mucin C.1-like [Haliotis rufescens]|uniref:integumentary mucin C.1-like n=1 Tax=Haliotis rufescens TaxID=6454 RepID=UPI00201F190E|nr:integumentary mucin C.1-like [Haliotis rufescens]
MVALGNGQNSGHESGVFKTSRVPLVKLCHRLCWYYTSCRAYTWVRGTGSCQLSRDTRDTSPDPFSLSQHRVYSDARAPRELKSAHPCTRRPCDVVEVCVPVAAASGHLCLRRGAVHTQHFESQDVTSTTTPPPTTSTASTTTTPTTAASPTNTAPTTTESTASDTTTATPTTTTASPLTTTAATTTTVTTPPTTAPATTTTMPSVTSTATTAATTDAMTTTAAITTTVATTTIVSTTTTEITTVTTTSTTTTTPTTTNKHACVSDCKGLTGYYHSCSSCSKYVVCSFIGLSELSCGPTTEFDDIKKICTLAPSATCN